MNKIDLQHLTNFRDKFEKDSFLKMGYCDNDGMPPSNEDAYWRMSLWDLEIFINDLINRINEYERKLNNEY